MTKKQQKRRDISLMSIAPINKREKDDYGTSINDVSPKDGGNYGQSNANLEHVAMMEQGIQDCLGDTADVVKQRKEKYNGKFWRVSADVKVAYQVAKKLCGKEQVNSKRDAHDKQQDSGFGNDDPPYMRNKCRELYNNLLELSQPERCEKMTPVRQKMLYSAITKFELFGVNISKEKEERLDEIDDELIRLDMEFCDNLCTLRDKDPLVIKYVEDLGDMPDDIKVLTVSQDGTFCFPVREEFFTPFMEHCCDRKSREKMYRRWVSNASPCAELGADNSEVIKSILGLRAEKSTILGYDNFAQMALRGNMAKSPERVKEFLYDLLNKIRPKFVHEMNEMKFHAAKNLGIKDMQLWDIPFVEASLKRENFKFSSSDERFYLQVDKVIDGLSLCLDRLFGVTLHSDNESPLIEDPRLYKICKQGKLVSTVTLDLFEREDKHQADAYITYMDNSHPTIVCNFLRGVDGRSARMSMHQAELLFHEAGHLVHNVFASENDCGGGGLFGMEQDVGEMLSKFMENFIWQWPVLKSMTSHVKTGRPMPKHLFDNMLKAKNFNCGLRLVEELELAILDIELNFGDDRPFMDIFNDIRKKTRILNIPEWDYCLCSYCSIFSCDFGGLRYRYLWGRLLSADIFSMLEESGDIFNRNISNKIRKEMLETSNFRSTTDSFIAVRGRPPKTEALLKHCVLNSF